MTTRDRIRLISYYLQGHGKAITEEAERAGLTIPLACALVEQESNGRNIFGCDWGARWTWEPPYCNVPVTKERVAALLHNIDTGGGSNGVGLTQLTYPPLIKEAERIGGAHIVRNQLRVGFELLADYIDQYGTRTALGVYNGGPLNPQYAYADEVLEKRLTWRRRLYP